MPPGPGREAGRGGPLLVVVGAAALASSWNPVGAPFAAIAGVLVAAVAARRVATGQGRRLAAVALALGAGAVVASVLVLMAVVGVGFRPEHQLELGGRSPDEAQRLLDDAAARTRDARERARRELGELPPAEGAPGKGPPARPTR